MVGSWSRPRVRRTHVRWMIDTYLWQVSQGRFFVHQHSCNLPLNAEFCAMKSVVVSRVDWWRTFLTNCEERHNNLSKLNCRTHIAVAMIRGLRQALTRIGCLQVLEIGLTGEEPCLAEMTDYDHMYHDNVTGASLPCKMCEEAMQLEIKWNKEMDERVHLLRARSRERATPHSDWGTMGLHEQRWLRTSFDLCQTGCSEHEEDDKDGPEGHVHDIRCDTTCWGISICSLEGDDRREKKEPTGWDSILRHLKGAFSFAGPHKSGDSNARWSIMPIRNCHTQPSIDLYCERTMEKLDYNIGVFNPCLYKHLVKDVSVLRHGDDFATLATRTQIAEFKWANIYSWSILQHRVRDNNSLTFVKYKFCIVCHGGLCRHLEKRQNVLRSKLIQDMQSCWSKIRFAVKQQRSEHSRRASKRQFTHSQTFTTRCHIIQF